MRPFTRKEYRCYRCGWKLDGRKQNCPECGFEPRQRGIRVAMYLFMAFILLMTVLIAMTMTGLGGGAGLILLDVALILFVLSVVLFFVSLLTTPYRLGWLFEKF